MNFFKRFVSPSGRASPDESVRALLKAAERGAIEEVRHLLELGTDVDTADKRCRSALMFASWKHHLEVVRYLLDEGATVNAQDSSGTTALILALGGADWKKMEIYGQIDASAMEIGSALISTDRAGVSLYDRNGRTALMIAAWCGSLPLTEALIGRGADVNAALSKSIADLDVFPGNAPRGRYRPGDFVKTLATREGCTALMMASARGHVDIVRSLLRAGADPTVNSGGCARDVANSVLEIVKENLVAFTERERAEQLTAYRQIVLSLDAATAAWKPAVAQAAFIEAECPACRTKHALFPDDTNQLNCTCGAVFVVDRGTRTARITPPQ